MESLTTTPGKSDARTTPRLALVPLRVGHELRDGSQQGIHPYVPLFPRRSVASSTAEDKSSSFVLGRQDVLVSLHAACGCRSMQWEGHGGCGEQASGTRRKDPTLCLRCQQIRDWARRYLSRRMIRLTEVSKTSNFRVQARGENASTLVWVNGKKIISVVGGEAAMSTGDELEKPRNATEKQEGWMGNAFLSVGSVLALGSHLTAEATLLFMLVDLDKDEIWRNERVRTSVTAASSAAQLGDEPVSAEGTCLVREQMAGKVAPVSTQFGNRAQTDTQQGHSSKVAKPDEIKCFDEEDQRLAEKRTLGEETKKQQTNATSIVSAIYTNSQEVTGTSYKKQVILVANESVRLAVRANTTGGSDNDTDKMHLRQRNDDATGVVVGKQIYPSECKRDNVVKSSETAPSFAPTRGNVDGCAIDDDRGDACVDVCGEATANTSSPPVRLALGGDSESRRIGDKLFKGVLCNASPKGQTLPAGTFSPKAHVDILDLCSPSTRREKTSSSSMKPNFHAEVEVIEMCESGDDDVDTKLPCPTMTATKDETRTVSVAGPYSRAIVPHRDHRAGSPRVLLLQLGRSMSLSRVQILRSMMEKRKDVTVTDSFSGEQRRGGESTVACTPTHVVIDEAATAAQAASALGLRDAEDMANIFAERTIKAVKPDWVVSGRFPSEPTLEQCWMGLRGVKMKTSRKRQACKERTGPLKSGGWMKKKQRSDEFVKISVVKASSLRLDDDDCFVSRVLKRRREEGRSKILTTSVVTSDIAAKLPNERVRNKGLADMFDQLSKLHKVCPILENDEWRTYHYAVIAGRLRSLDFDVIDRRDVLDRLSKIKGFGASAMTKVREYLKMGKCHKLTELRKDPMRAGVSRLIKIHGVGSSKAKELVKQGYNTIGQVRKGLSNGALHLSGVSLIGVSCYEDFLEKMDRTEAELIVNIVVDACKEQYPDIEASIMGSYRRGKEGLGDVDILLTHPDYVNTIPRGALGDLVNRLRRRGHIAYDLNHVEGLITPSELLREDSDSSTLLISPPLEMTTLCSRQEMTKSVSYMGVFFSPAIQGKKRRVDIKFYPHREKAFATLYFTGSGWFNRSMRLWATRKKQMSLNDHGLFPINMAGGAMKATGTGKEYRGDRIGAASEKDIFDMLDLEYRQPHERDCFDAVVEKGSLKPIDLDGDFAKDPNVLKVEASHAWID